MKTLNTLDLFTGIGGFSLGLEKTGGFKTVAFCEIDKFCQKVLKKHWPDVPIYDDVRSLDYDGTVDVICGGFPCQPFSVAGKRKGKEDDRHLWPAMFNLIKKHKPRWVIGENVAGLIDMGLDDVLADLESEAYTTRTFVIPACAVNAPHRRDRVWIVANANSGRCLHGKSKKQPAERRVEALCESTGCCEDVADTTLMLGNGKQNNSIEGKRQISKLGGGGGKNDVSDSHRIRSDQCGERGDMEGKLTSNREQQRSGWTSENRRHSGWESEPDVGRVANGVPSRVDRLKALGNAVVSQIPEIIGRAIMEIEHEL